MPSDQLGSYPAEPAFEAPETIARMLFATWALLYSLSPDQRRVAEYPMDDPGRFDWDFIPKPDRQGVPLADLSPHQRTIAQTLLAAGSSINGYSQILSIMAMENMLRELERKDHDVLAGDFRHADQYFLVFYGRPGFEDTWGWRILGHHLSLNYTIIAGRYLTTTPCNMGAQPAAAGLLAPLRDDEDRAFALLDSMTSAQRGTTVIHHTAPADYVTRQVPKIGRFEIPDYRDLGIDYYTITDEDRRILTFDRDAPAGICADQLDPPQLDVLLGTVQGYLDRMPYEVAGKQMDRIEKAGASSLYFCWAGGEKRGTSHYYRIQGDHFLIEFDNAIDNGNHIHSVWRDYANDLGDGLLQHYREAAGRSHHLNSRLTSSTERIAPPDR